ncbi:MAG TPA: hypothetical protein VK843_05095 [Planctomycetota bacterium]|nr:hypothetical protein [Planctomycetota bacterium]
MLHRQRLEHMANQLQKEGRDVRQLEGVSLTALFHTFLGDRREQLDQERKEFLALKLRYDAELQTALPLQDDAERCRAELETLGDLESTRATLFREREQSLLQSGSAAGCELTALCERLAEARADLRELDEALVAGRRALETLDTASDQLGRARGWGSVDMLAGGLITTSIKHSHIDRARNAAERAQGELQRFARELLDLGSRPGGLEIKIDGFEKFADYFFDGLISDWIVQSKIVRSSDTVLDMRSKVRKILAGLTDRHSAQAKSLAQLEAERERLLTAPD